jgi:hypothetical protein
MVLKRIKGEGIPDTLIIHRSDSEAYKVELAKNGEVDTEKLSCLLTKNMRDCEIFGAQVLNSKGEKVGLVLELGKTPKITKPEVVFVAETSDYVVLLKMRCRLNQTEAAENIEVHRIECSKGAPS